MTMNRRNLLGLAAGAALLAATGSVQAFPDKNLTIIVPYSPGATDQLARAVGAEVEKALGKTVLVETKPGAGGTVGANIVAKSDPDGSTMLIAVSSVQTVAPHERKLPYGFDDLKPVARLTVGPNVMAARTGAPFNDLKSLVAYAKAHPNKVSFGSAGTGGATHLAGEAFAQAAGIKLNHIPFQGVTPAIAATVGGTVDLVLGYASAIMPQVEGGKLVAIAQFGDKRASVLPNLTTLKEGGVDLALPPNIGIWVPAGTPDDVVATLEAAFKKAMQSESVQAFAKKNMTEIDFAGSKAFRGILEKENAFYEKLLKSLGMAKS